MTPGHILAIWGLLAGVSYAVHSYLNRHNSNW